jgi:hypothetical protein
LKYLIFSINDIEFKKAKELVHKSGHEKNQMSGFFLSEIS